LGSILLFVPKKQILWEPPNSFEDERDDEDEDDLAAPPAFLLVLGAAFGCRKRRDG
jgi:hypothetical protein